MTKEQEEAVQKIREIAIEDTKVSRELGIKFFFHWTILSGATLTLLIPFLSSEQVKENIAQCSALYAKVAIISFIVSLISAALRNFVMMFGILDRAKINHKIANDFSNALATNSDYKSGESKDNFKVPLRIIEFLAIFSFILGIISAYVFISKVIF